MFTSISLVMNKLIQMSAEDWLLVAVDANHCSYGLSVQLRMPDTKSGWMPRIQNEEFVSHQDSLKLFWGYIRSWCTIFFATSLLPPRTFLKSQLNKHMNPILEIDLMINSKFSQSTFHYISSIWLYPQIRSEHSEVDAISQKPIITIGV